MKKNVLATIALLAGGAACFAQGPQHRAGSGTPALDMTKLQTITGTVSDVNIGYGMAYPSITVNQLQIKLAPVWYLLDKGFEIKAGDAVSLVAAPSTLTSDAYLHAIEITNTSTKVRIELRDSSGLPLWTRRGGGNGAGSGPMAQGGCCDVSTAVTATGTVDKVSMGVGIQMPTLTLNAGGTLLVIKLGPERILLEADLELKAGDTVTVKYVQAACTDELVALSITVAGKTVVLRDDDCRPAWNR